MPDTCSYKVFDLNTSSDSFEILTPTDLGSSPESSIVSVSANPNDNTILSCTGSRSLPEFNSVDSDQSDSEPDFSYKKVINSINYSKLIF